MNPLLYKAHPLLSRWIELLTHPGSQSVSDLLVMALVLLGGNIILAIGLFWLIRKAEEVVLTPGKAYWLALPASFLYTPVVLTALQDVIKHDFELKNRFFLLFGLVVISQLLTAFFAFAIKDSARSGQPIGLESGLAASLLLLLLSIPVALVLMGINFLSPFF